MRKHQRAYIFGAGSTGRKSLTDIKKHYEVIGFLDNDSNKWGGSIEGYMVGGHNLNP